VKLWLSPAASFPNADYLRRLMQCRLLLLGLQSLPRKYRVIHVAHKCGFRRRKNQPNKISTKNPIPPNTKKALTYSRVKCCLSV